jgi:hypothetical protein
MSRFVESLKRNYNKNFITVEYLDYLLLEGKLAQEEYDYIKG